MGALGDRRGVDPLLNLLRDTHPFVRTQTALALGKLQDRRAIDALVDVIDETPRGTVRDAVLLGISLLLEQLGHTVPESLPDDERAWRAFVERTAGYSSDPPDLRKR
jgi:HEAT repeat protein